MSEAHIVEIRNQRGETVVSGEFRSRVDALGNTENDAALIDRRGRTVIGEVELEIPPPSRQDRRVELEVDIIGLPGRETFAVVIDDRTVGTFTTDDRGQHRHGAAGRRDPFSRPNSGHVGRSAGGPGAVLHLSPCDGLPSLSVSRC